MNIVRCPYKAPKRRLKDAVSKISTIRCDNPETERDRMSVSLLLITNRKSHIGFRLTPTLMTLNDLERRNSHYFAFFAEIDSFGGRLCHSG